MRWSDPLMLLGLLPLLGALFYIWKIHLRRPCLSFSNIYLFKSAGAREYRSLWSFVPIALFSLGLIALGLSLGKPQISDGTIYSPSKGLDIMVCLDTSGSMRNTDMAPSRMDVAKDVTMRFVKERLGDRIGLVIFGGIALMQCPLTIDHIALNHFIDSIAIGMTGVDHTALGDGIASSVAHLSQVEGEGRVIIVVTDGRNNVGEIDPYMAARLAAQNDIKIYAIGIGSATEAPLQGISNDEELDEPCLRELATITSGRYFRATDAKSLADIYSQIDRLEKRVAIQELLSYRDIYAWFIMFASIAIFLAFILESTLCMELP